MINSFWNLCRACPMPTEEKLNTEYARNFTWHQGYQTTKQEVVKKVPEASALALMEPILPRKKKYPDLAYRTHQVLKQEGIGSKFVESINFNIPTLQYARDHVDIRARSEERSNNSCKMGPRSRSADPNVGREKQKDHLGNPGRKPQEKGVKNTKDGDVAMALSYPPPCRPHGNPGVRKTEDQQNKMSEYRSQYAWPNIGMEASQPATRKSVSMGSIATQALQMEGSSARLALAATHIPYSESGTRFDRVPEASTSVKIIETQSKPKSNGGAKVEDLKRKLRKTEYKAKFRPFSTYVYIDGGWKKPSKIKNVTTKLEVNPWYTEVVERLKKADEYRWRAHGRPLYGEQQGVPCCRQSDVWNQVWDKNLVTAVATTKKQPAKDDKTRDRPHTAPTAKVPLPKSLYRKPRNGQVKHEKPLKSKLERKKKREPEPTDTEEQTGDKADVPSARRTASAPARTSSAASQLPSTWSGQKLSSQGKAATPSKRARPKSAEPTLGLSKRDSKSPKHLTKQSISIPESSTKPKENLAGPSESPTKKDTKHKIGRTSFKTPKTSEQVSHAVKPRPIHASASATAVVNGEDGKIWLKPSTSEAKTIQCDKDKEKPTMKESKDSSKDSLSDETSMGKTNTVVEKSDKKDATRPNTLPSVNGMDLKSERLNDSSSQAEPLPGPVQLTTVRSPEEVTGVKSPDPESWTVPIETGKGLEWTDGQTPGEEPVRAKSPPAVPSKPVEIIPSAVNSEPVITQVEPAPSESAPKVPPSTEVPNVEMVSPSAGRMLASDVLDRARSRLDQFWSKNK
ncbi:fibrous sheath CABYR-binding protein-like [Centruroides vittatus]|uniref:fibrous sheath CABYR-binding protein-like n=1 Tax=Centruroides vittatus TaxID=120091 RepID=UPI003510ACB0